MIQEEFALRGESYRRAQAREDELHQLKVAERKWLAAAAEELYKKNCLEREIAEIKLKELKNK